MKKAGYKMKMGKVLITLIAVILLFGSVFGCSGKSAENKKDAGSAGSGKLDPVTLKIMIPGDRPKDMDKVLAEAEKRMADTINVKLDVVFIPWSDLGEKTQVTLSSGEPVDLIFDAPWLHIQQMVDAGFYEPLEDLLNKYGPDILAARPDDMWKANQYNGKIYGIPLGAQQFAPRGFAVRKDIREKLHVPPLKSFEDVYAFAKKIKDSGENIAPLTPESVWGSKTVALFEYYWDYETNFKAAIDEGLPVLYLTDNKPVVRNMFEDMLPSFKEKLHKARDLYKQGVVNKDVMAIKFALDEFIAGKTAIVPYDDVSIASTPNSLAGNVPGAQMEVVHFFDKSKKLYTDFRQANFIMVSANSKNKERAIMFLNWANQKENYDLLSYGIKGVHWEPVGDDQYKTLNNDYPWFAYDWIWSPKNHRFDASYSPEDLAWQQFFTKSDNFMPSVLTGFNFNTSAVTNELSQLMTLNSQYFPAIGSGVTDPDQSWEEYKKKANGFVKTIQQEYQKQLDAFMAKK